MKDIYGINQFFKHDLSKEECCNILRIDRKTVKRLIISEEIKLTEDGKIEVESLKDFLERNAYINKPLL